MRIAVIGAGMAGLRAALELVPHHTVTVFEKSSGVGGRVASRRYGEIAVNHGAKHFDRREIISTDPMAEKFKDHFSFAGAATDLPKKMRDMFVDLGGVLKLRTRIHKFSEDTLHFEDGTSEKFDRYIFTAPIPQIREIFGTPVLPEVAYTKAILFIGVRNGMPVTEIIADELAEKIFEMTDEEIRGACSPGFSDLELKKWRYARVKKGVAKDFYREARNVIIAGEAFDPNTTYDLASAWNSGRIAGSEFK